MQINETVLMLSFVTHYGSIWCMSIWCSGICLSNCPVYLVSWCISIWRIIWHWCLYTELHPEAFRWYDSSRVVFPLLYKVVAILYRFCPWHAFGLVLDEIQGAVCIYAIMMDEAFICCRKKYNGVYFCLNCFKFGVGVTSVLERPITTNSMNPFSCMLI